MRRDMDLVREILRGTADSHGSLDGSVFVDGAHDLQEVAYNVDLLVEAELVDAKVIREWGGMAVRVTVFRLTWDGNEFLDAVDNDTVWKRVKLKVAQLTGTATFDVVKQLAVSELTKMLMQ